MHTCATKPRVGSICRAVANHSLRPAVVGSSIVQIPRGTLLRITRLDDRWDNSHALIARFAQARASLRVLDGPGAGERVAVAITADAVPDPDGGESESWQLPDWLELVDAACRSLTSSTGSARSRANRLAEGGDFEPGAGAFGHASVGHDRD